VVEGPRGEAVEPAQPPGHGGGVGEQSRRPGENAVVVGGHLILERAQPLPVGLLLEQLIDGAVLVHDPDPVVGVAHAVTGKLQADHLVDLDAVEGAEILLFAVAHQRFDATGGGELEGEAHLLDLMPGSPEGGGEAVDVVIGPAVDEGNLTGGYQ